MANFLKDHENNNSSTRLVNLLWALGILIGWLFVAITTKSLPDIPAGPLAILGMVLTAKVVQTHIERSTPQPKKEDAAND